MVCPPGLQGALRLPPHAGVLCLSSQGAACPAPSCAPTPCSGSWSSAGPTSLGSGRASAPSTRSCRASASGIGEARPASQASGLPREIVPPPQLQLTVRAGSPQLWTPATGIRAAGGDAAPCLLCSHAPVRASSSKQK